MIDKNVTVDALKNINLKVEKGDIYGIIGLSSAASKSIRGCRRSYNQHQLCIASRLGSSEGCANY